MKMLNSPFRWVGGKSRLRKYIIPVFPAHECYVEPFGGAGWVMFGKERSKVEIFNDLDQEVVNFFRVVKGRPADLLQAFKWEIVSRAEFDRLAALDPRELDEVARAHRFYYIIMACWGGELKHPRFQTSIIDGGGANRLIGALCALEDRIAPIHDRLRSVLIENLSWQECIDRYDRAGGLMYIDPPYPGNKCNYFHNMRSQSDHLELAERLANTKCKWVLSSYDREDIHIMYEGFWMMPLRSMSGMKKSDSTSRVENKELLVMNFKPNISLDIDLD